MDELPQLISTSEHNNDYNSVKFIDIEAHFSVVVAEGRPLDTL